MKVIMPCWIVNESLQNQMVEAIKSLRQSDTFLIIIDNGSPMGGGLMRELADLYIRNKENLGYAKAVNQGLKLCESGELVAVANDDIQVSPNWQEVAKEVFKEKSVASLHFRMYFPTDEPVYGNETWITGKERWCTGSFFVIKNSWLFDENFLNSYDDWDIHYRMYKGGFHTAYTNKAYYFHEDSSTQKFIPERDKNNERNFAYFAKKHGVIAEDAWTEMFPTQYSLPYRPFP